MAIAPEVHAAVAAWWSHFPHHRNAVVVVGGMAAHLYALHPDFRPVPLLQALPTVDLDLGVRFPLQDPAIAPSILDQATQAGLRILRDPPTTTAAPMTRIILPTEGAHGAPPYLEFIADTTQPGSIVEVEPGLWAYPSPWAWMLLAQPWSVFLPTGEGPIRIPHPLGYVAHKALVATARRIVKAGKDWSDAIWVLGGLASAWPTLAGEGPTLSGDDETRRDHLQTARNLLAHHLERPNGSGIILAADHILGGIGQISDVATMRAVLARSAAVALRGWPVTSVETRP